MLYNKKQNKRICEEMNGLIKENCNANREPNAERTIQEIE